jgi:hypothetical protein
VARVVLISSFSTNIKINIIEIKINIDSSPLNSSR